MSTFKSDVAFPGKESYEVVTTPTYLLARDEDCENTFHSTADFVSYLKCPFVFNLSLLPKIILSIMTSYLYSFVCVWLFIWFIIFLIDYFIVLCTFFSKMNMFLVLSATNTRPEDLQVIPALPIMPHPYPTSFTCHIILWHQIYSLTITSSYTHLYYTTD